MEASLSTLPFASRLNIAYDLPNELLMLIFDQMDDNFDDRTSILQVCRRFYAIETKRIFRCLEILKHMDATEIQHKHKNFFSQLARALLSDKSRNKAGEVREILMHGRNWENRWISPAICGCDTNRLDWVHKEIFQKAKQVPFFLARRFRTDMHRGKHYALLFFSLCLTDNLVHLNLGCHADRLASSLFDYHLNMWYCNRHTIILPNLRKLFCQSELPSRWSIRVEQRLAGAHHLPFLLELPSLEYFQVSGAWENKEHAIGTALESWLLNWPRPARSFLLSHLSLPHCDLSLRTISRLIQTSASLRSFEYHPHLYDTDLSAPGFTELVDMLSLHRETLKRLQLGVLTRELDFVFEEGTGWDEPVVEDGAEVLAFEIASNSQDEIVQELLPSFRKFSRLEKISIPGRLISEFLKQSEDWPLLLPESLEQLEMTGTIPVDFLYHDLPSILQSLRWHSPRWKTLLLTEHMYPSLRSERVLVRQAVENLKSQGLTVLEPRWFRCEEGDW